MMKSSSGDVARGHVPGGLLAIVFGAIGALVALLLGLLTFGVQATVRPSHLPLAVGASDPALAPITLRVAAEGGDAVSWRTVGSRAEAERLLDRREVYGAVVLDTSPSGPTATVILSGALNPSAAQVAQPALTQVADAVVTAARAQAAARPGPAAQAAPAPPVRVVTIHPTSAAGRTLPLAASALLWLATLVASVLVVAAAPALRGGRDLGRWARLTAAGAAALLSAAAVAGLAWLWDAGIPLGADAFAFLLLVGLAFALVQTGVLRWLGVRGVAVLAPLYLMAPAVAGLVPELLHPVYRAALWSWTPFRFSTEGLRSLLFLGRDGPDVQAALWVFGAVAVAGLLLTIAPGRRSGGARAASAPYSTASMNAK
jgi:hypothetical protein